MPRSAKRKARSSAPISDLFKKPRIPQRTEPSQTPTIGLHSLPKELVLEIFDKINWPRTFYRLCLTCRQFFQLTKPYLYYAVDSYTANTAGLITSLSRELSMRENVRSLMWWNHNPRRYRSTQTLEKLKLPHTSRRELCKIVEQLGVGFPLMSFDLRYLQAFHDGTEHPSTRSATPPWFSLLEEIGSSHKATLSQHLSHLHSIHIRMGYIRLPEIRRIISLPSLRNLHIEHVYRDGPAVLWSEAPVVSARSSPIESLWIKSCEGGSQDVVQLLNCIRGLKDFYVEFGCVKCWRRLPGRNYSDRQLNYPALKTAILAHKDSLEKLDVRGIIMEESCFPTTTHEGLGSLRDLCKVERFIFGLDCFGPKDFDWNYSEDLRYQVTEVLDKLPPGVVTITLIINESTSKGYEEYWTQCLRSLAKSCKPTLVALEEIILRRDSGRPITFGKNMEDIQTCLLDAGVGLGTLSTRGDA